MKISIIILTIFLTNCAGNQFSIPADINTNVNGTVRVDIPNSTQTVNVNVSHTVGISVDLANYFKTNCTTQVDAAPIALPEPQRTDAINACVAATVQSFFNTIMSIINQGVAK